jgi:hypothetical protein
LRTGIKVRERIVSDQAHLQSIYLNLERLAQELRNTIVFNKGDPDFPVIKGSEENIEFYSLCFDYVSNSPKILHITYSFKDKVLSKSIQEPYKSLSPNSYSFIENLESVRFQYYDIQEPEEPEKWKDVWEEPQRLPKGVKIELVYQDDKGRENSLDKHIFLYRKQD